MPFLLIVSINAYSQSTPKTQEIWEKGMEAKETGNYEAALRYWSSAIRISGKADPRIGFSYIELATEQRMKEHYQKASKMYNWGLSNCVGVHEETIKTEVERVSPIAGDEIHKQWKRLLKTEPASVCESLIKFWELVDPTVATPYNERLIEHWERIAYAREHFRRNRVSIYNADERAVIYVKLGKPDYVRSGTMHFNSSLVRAWAQDGMEFHTSFNTTGSFSEVQGGGDSASGTAMQRQYLAQRMVKEVMAENVLKQARLTHRYPYYEIWVYKKLVSETGDNIIYIFGEDGDTGGFGLQRSLEEMIPNSAFRTTVVDRSPISPGFLLQMLFYEQTSIADNYFADGFNELQSALYTLNRFNSQASYSVRSQKASQLRFLQYKAPRERSTYMEELPNISLEVYQYRMLDEQKRPYLATFVKSQPHKAFFFDQLKLRKYEGSGYRLYHHSRLIDENNDVVDQQVRRSQIYTEGAGSVDGMRRSSAYFKIPNNAEGTLQTFSVELQNLNTDSVRVGETVFPEHIRAISKVGQKQPEPLSSETDELEASDVLIGVDEGTEVVDERGPTDFRVLHDRVIPANQNMMIHFEVYNLVPDQAGGPNRFEVEYQVKKRRRNILQRIFGGSSEKVRLTLNFETLESFFAGDLEIGTLPFEPGRYQLLLNISQPGRDQTVERVVDFEISEQE